MTPLTTAAAATRTVRVIRSPPGSQLERNRAFWRMISASFMQVSDAHLHRRNRRRSASVTRSSATPPRRASSSSSSDTADAGAADDGDYELEERSAGNTPRPRSATCSRAISPAAPRKHTSRKSKSPASPSSSRAARQDNSDDSAGKLRAHRVSRTPTASNWLHQQASKPAARGNGHRLVGTARSSQRSAPALSISILNRSRMSLCLLRTLLPRVMTATEASLWADSRCYPLSAAARHTPTIGGPSIPPSPICRGSGVHPHPHPRFAGDRGSTPIPIPDLPGIGDHPHPRFPSGVPCPGASYLRGFSERLESSYARMDRRGTAQPSKLRNVP